jgi:RNA polymerase sigma-70 factor (ECF subfamily)
MNTTSLSFLNRLKHARPDDSDWLRLQDIYAPLIRQWLSHVEGLRDESEDLTQDVLVVLVRELPSFERRRDGAFRAWLRQVTVNRIRTFWKSKRRRPPGGRSEDERLLAQLEDPTSDLSRQWDREHDRHVFHRLLQVVQADFEPHTWQAFTRFALDGVPAAEVASELDMSEGAVVQAKFRVLKRLREEASEMLD